MKNQMLQKVFSFFFLLCFSFTASATTIFTITGNTVGIYLNTHGFDPNSVAFTSTEGYTLDIMDNSIIELLSTGSLAIFNNFTSYLSQTNIGTETIVDTAISNSLSITKNASILDVDDIVILEGTLNINSEWFYSSLSGDFTMTFDAITNTGGSGSGGGGTSAIPVPAAAWLFGSGLLGLMSVARRKA